MAFLSIVELARVAGMRPEMLSALTRLMANFEARTGLKTTVPADGGVRTYARQAELVADRDRQGATYPVAPPGTSRHEFGGAVDLNIIGQTTGNAATDSANPYYNILAEEAAKLGLVAGIDFSNTDPYHFELNESLAEAQAAWAAYSKKKLSYWRASVSALSSS